MMHWEGYWDAWRSWTNESHNYASGRQDAARFHG